MTNDEYLNFENQFRGSRELILGRLASNYAQLLSSAHEHLHGLLAVDIGCGRGEWLQLLDEHGYETLGFDSDPGMLSEASKHSSNVRLVDALEGLKSLPDSSVGILSGFHLVEHLPQDVLLDLIVQARRVLVAGGIVIFETPNPENVTVGSNTFYLDPTHVRPIPPASLQFTLQSHGFDHVAIWRLQSSPEIEHAERKVQLHDVFFEVSPDYAVVAQKPGSNEAMPALESELTRPRGVTLSELCVRFQVDQSEAIQTMEAKLRGEFDARFDAIFASRSWRVTKPLRAIGNFWRSRKLK